MTDLKQRDRSVEVFETVCTQLLHRRGRERFCHRCGCRIRYEDLSSVSRAGHAGGLMNG